MRLREKIRKLLLVPTFAEWQRWTIGDRLTLVGTYLSAIGLAFSIYMALPATVPDVYAVDDSNHDKYVELFRTGQFGQRDKLRIGCINWSEASCLAAGKFLRLLSEAGWEIESHTVHSVLPAVPVEGVSILSGNYDRRDLSETPPHLGRWTEMSVSQGVLTAAFKLVGVPVRFSSDASLPPGTTGVYFGPKPKPDTSVTQKNEKARRKVLSYIGSGMLIQRACTQERAVLCVGELFSWEQSVSSFLQQNGFSSTDVNSWLGLPQARVESVNADMNRKLSVLLRFALGLE